MTLESLLSIKMSEIDLSVRVFGMKREMYREQKVG